MCSISLSMSRGAKSTVISNRFIDNFLPEANGSYVKVYIYLLRLLSDSSQLSLSLIAERLDETEKDIRRALKYWEDKGVLTVKYNSMGEITDIVFLNPDSGDTRETPAQIVQIFDTQAAKTEEYETYDYYSEEEIEEIYPAAEPEPEKPAVGKRPTYSPKQIAMVMDDPGMANLAQRIEKRIKRPLSQSDSQVIMFLVDCLQFSSDLIYHLYDYCSERGKISSSYIEKVALNWAQNGIKTVEDANRKNDQYADQILTVCKAFGFTRNPAEAEKIYIRRWFNDFGFTADMVKEACDRTILSAKKADFRYADKILSTWNQVGIRTSEDLAAYEAEYRKTQSKRPAVKKPASQAVNKFNAFPQRNNSEELADLEKVLMNK